MPDRAAIQRKTFDQPTHGSASAMCQVLPRRAQMLHSAFDRCSERWATNQRAPDTICREHHGSTDSSSLKASRQDLPAKPQHLRPQMQRQVSSPTFTGSRSPSTCPRQPAEFSPPRAQDPPLDPKHIATGEPLRWCLFCQCSSLVLPASSRMSFQTSSLGKTDVRFAALH